ncbi:MAG TPA: ferric reductase-like transmembrane domain-containing protein, partial [Gaiella sp.]|nr:ferric reductase-like transmembrane domain-containing protein [Gaiella sp.]
MSGWNAVTWDTARAGGLVSYVLLTTSVSLGLVLRNRWQSSRWPRLITNELHGYVSLLALVFIAVHVVAVAVDPFTHFGLAAVLVPFASHYRPIWMGLGIVGLYLLLAVWVSTRLRRRIGHRLWRQIHVLAFAVYAAATLHGLGTGSDTRTAWAVALYATSVGLVGTLLAIRLLAPAGRDARPRPLAGLASAVAVVAAAVWSLSGPLAPGWSVRAGGATARAAIAHPHLPPAARGSRPSAVVHVPFTARYAGRLTVDPMNDQGRVTVRIDGALSGATRDHLEILIHGIPLEDGGVAMEQSRVRMGTTTALY